MKNMLFSMGISVLFAGCTIFAENPSTSISTKTMMKNKMTTQQFYDQMVNKQDLKMIDSLVHPDYVEHQTDPHYPANRKGLKKEFQDYFEAFPDLQTKVNFMVAEGDMVVVHYTSTGTHMGAIYGKDASNKKIEIRGVDVIRYKDGKGIEHWGYLEEGKLLTQLGMIKHMLKQ
jgi:steroid delta-isomerase-like uncharacterized protein